MIPPARRMNLRGIVEYRDEAETLLEAPGDAAFVERGALRSLVMRCPDGCGESLVVNLDPRVGKAWRVDRRQDTTTLYPSVWRDGGCESHFIVWKDIILWCDRFEDENSEPACDSDIETQVLGALHPIRHADVETLASSLGLLVWDVWRALRRLVGRGEVSQGVGRLRGTYLRVLTDKKEGK